VLGIEQAVIEGVDFEGGEVVARVRVYRRQRLRCSRCRRACGKHDDGRGRRRWRALDLVTTKLWIEADAPRVRCPRHGVVVAHVPWARPGSGFTRAFEDQVAWLCVHATQSVVGRLQRIAWRTVGRVLRRVVDEASAGRDLLDGVTRIGVDETSYRRGHRYLTVVVCHDSGRLVWAHPGNSKATLESFLAELGPERCKLITHISADGADWIHTTLQKACVNAVVCMDAFHVVKVRHEAPCYRVGCKDPPPVCHSRLVKLRAA
jgi:transposase